MDVPAAEGQGVLFLCPVCFKANGGPVGTHSIIVWFSNPLSGPIAPPEMHPHVRWTRAGDSIDTLTITPSIAIIGGCAWHGHVRDGAIV